MHDTADGTTMTIREFINMYRRLHLPSMKNPRVIECMIEQYFGPFHDVPLAALTRLQIIEWHQQIGRTYPCTANWCLSRLRHMFNCAIDWEIHHGVNPAVRIKRFPQRSRMRFVQPEEMPRLLQALDLESDRMQAYFHLVLLTGARRCEAIECRWADLRLDEGLWVKPTTKTGHEHIVPLPAVLCHRLRTLIPCCPYLFHSALCDSAISVACIERTWRRIRHRAGLDDVRIHDLRRTTASWLAIQGANLPVIQNVLGHTSLRCTSIYARLNVAVVRTALEQHAQRMAAMPAEALDTQRGSIPQGSTTPQESLIRSG